MPKVNQPSYPEWLTTRRPMMGAETPEPLAPEPTEPVQGDPQNEPPSDPTTPPWGEDFQPERAWKTITTQRQREKELEQQLGEAKQVRDLWEAAQNDPSAAKQFLNSLGYDVEDDEPPAEGEPDLQAELNDLKQWRSQQETSAREGQIANEFSTHTDDLRKNADLSLTDHEFNAFINQAWPVALQTADKAKVESLFKEYVGAVTASRKAVIDDYVKSKKTSRPAPSGVPGSDKFDHSDEDQRRARMAAAIEAAGHDE